jgi:NADP-dependent 3-hydroxy acid dehydrogenase YdfG
MDHEDRVAVITGGGTGIGAATAKELASAGVKVVVVGRRPEPLEEVARYITDRGGVAVPYPADISEYAAMEQLASTTLERFGRIDLLVPNASVHDVSKIAEGDPEWWRTLMLINAVGLFNTVRAFIPYMIKQAQGHVIVVSSASGRITYVGEAIYVASKHAQVAFVECLRLEMIEHGIKVSIVEPGMVDTPMIDNPFAAELKKTVPPLDAEDVAKAVRYIFEQPANCTINEVVMRPLKQLL